MFDEVGVEFDTRAQVSEAVQAALIDMARDRATSRPMPELTLWVRDSGGDVILQGVLVLRLIRDSGPGVRM